MKLDVATFIVRIWIDVLIAERFLRPGDIVLDGGAHDGSLAGAFLQMGAGYVHAVEPVPELAQQIRARRLPKCTVHTSALTDTMGVGQLLISQAHDRGSTLCEDAIAPMFPAVFGEHHRHITVSTITLDGLHHVVGTPFDYVKLDVEGMEPAALRGGVDVYHYRRRPHATVCELYPPVLTEGLALLNDYHAQVKRAILGPTSTELLLLDIDAESPPGCPAVPPMYVGWDE